MDEQGAAPENEVRYGVVDECEKNRAGDERLDNAKGKVGHTSRRSPAVEVVVVERKHEGSDEYRRPK